MPHITFSDYRRMARLHPAAADRVWADGQTIGFTQVDCETAVAGMVAADFGDGRFAMVQGLVGPSLTLPASLMAAVRLIPGWAGATPQIRHAGMALALAGLAQGIALMRTTGGTLVPQADGGVVIMLG